MVDGKKLGTTAVVRGKIKGDAFVEQQEVFEAYPMHQLVITMDLGWSSEKQVISLFLWVTGDKKKYTLKT
jgi:hypothetical protein